MIISVPHSGTRSLKDRLGMDTHWHFNSVYDDRIRDFEGHAHIPIRNPIDVAISWDARYVNEYGGTIADMLKSMDEMLDFISRYPRRSLYRMEDHKVLESSRGPESDVRVTRSSPRINALRNWLTGDRLRFYEDWYDMGVQ